MTFMLAVPKAKGKCPTSVATASIFREPAEAAAIWAIEQGIDCIVAETPPFFSVVRWLGEWPRTLFLDYGEPPAEFFPDGAARRMVEAE